MKLVNNLALCAALLTAGCGSVNQDQVSSPNETISLAQKGIDNIAKRMLPGQTCRLVLERVIRATVVKYGVHDTFTPKCATDPFVVTYILADKSPLHIMYTDTGKSLYDQPVCIPFQESNIDDNAARPRTISILTDGNSGINIHCIGQNPSSEIRREIQWDGMAAVEADRLGPAVTPYAPSSQPSSTGDYFIERK